MNKDFWERIDRLEELAKKAMPDHQVVYEDGEERYVLTKFIAAANPAMILEMIAEMRKLEKEVNWLAMKCQNVRRFPTMNGRPEDDWTAYKWREAARKNSNGG